MFRTWQYGRRPGDRVVFLPRKAATAVGLEPRELKSELRRVDMRSVEVFGRQFGGRDGWNHAD